MAYHTANKRIYSLFSNSSWYSVFSPKYYTGPIPGEFENNNVCKFGGGGGEEGAQQSAPFTLVP